jgi:hypothetical protein
MRQPFSRPVRSCRPTREKIDVRGGSPSEPPDLPEGPGTDRGEGSRTGCNPPGSGANGIAGETNEGAPGDPSPRAASRRRTGRRALQRSSPGASGHTSSRAITRRRAGRRALQGPRPGTPRNPSPRAASRRSAGRRAHQGTSAGTSGDASPAAASRVRAGHGAAQGARPGVRAASGRRICRVSPKATYRSSKTAG